MKAMKTLTQCLCALALVVSTTSAFALNSGYWDLTSGLANGGWNETFNPTPGTAGSMLSANDLAQWSMTGFTSLGAVAAGGGVYNTTYVNGTVNLGDEPLMWGTGGTISGMTLYNVSTFTQFVVGGVTYNQLQFSFTATDVSGAVAISGSWIGNDEPVALGGLGNYDIIPTSQSGNQFTTLTLRVPDGGSTLVLLGAALSTIGLLRRKLLA